MLLISLETNNTIFWHKMSTDKKIVLKQKI